MSPPPTEAEPTATAQDINTLALREVVVSLAGEGAASALGMLVRVAERALRLLIDRKPTTSRHAVQPPPPPLLTRGSASVALDANDPLQRATLSLVALNGSLRARALLLSDEGITAVHAHDKLRSRGLWALASAALAMLMGPGPLTTLADKRRGADACAEELVELIGHLSCLETDQDTQVASEDKLREDTLLLLLRLPFAYFSYRRHRLFPSLLALTWPLRSMRDCGKVVEVDKGCGLERRRALLAQQLTSAHLAALLQETRRALASPRPSRLSCQRALTLVSVARLPQSEWKKAERLLHEDVE